MNFAWPLVLFGLLAIPCVVAAYLWMLRRRRRFAVQHSNVARVKAAIPKRSSWRRHLPFALLVASIGVLMIAFARPGIERDVPSSGTTVILALDVSTSMCATDVEPNRLAASQAAAQAYVEAQRDGARIGIVAFSGTAQIVVEPTTDTDRLIEAIAGFTTSRGTAIGSATLKAIDAIAELDPDVAPAGADLADASSSSDPTGDETFVPEIVVLLTDGAVSAGVDPIEAADQAAARRVRVYTIGFGTDDPESLSCTPAQLGLDAAGNGLEVSREQLEEFRDFIVIDEPALQDMAEITGGEYFRARDADQLVDVFDTLPAVVAVQREEIDIAVWFNLTGGVLALAALVLALRWNRSY